MIYYIKCLPIPGVKVCHRFLESMSSLLYQWIYKCNLSFTSASMKTLLLRVSDTNVVGIITLWRELFKIIHCGWVLFAKWESLRYIPAQTIIVRLCNASQRLLLCVLFPVVALCLASTSAIKTALAAWRRIPHVTTLLYKVYLPITEGFVELGHYVPCTNSWVTVICTNIHGNSAIWMRQGNICLILLSTGM